MTERRNNLFFEDNFSELKEFPDWNGHQVPKIMGENRFLPKHVTVKFQNPGDKHKILQGSGEQGWGKVEIREWQKILKARLQAKN